MRTAAESGLLSPLNSRLALSSGFFFFSRRRSFLNGGTWNCVSPYPIRAELVFFFSFHLKICFIPVVTFSRVLPSKFDFPKFADRLGMATRSFSLR
jgi:hypothetical protein